MPQIVLSDGTRLAYDERGSGGPPLILIHGWCCDRTFLEPQAAHFSHGHRCVCIDLRGHGESDKPAAGYDIPRMADDVAAASDALGLGAAVVVGHSMGGAVGLALSARHPAAVAALVMLDGALIAPPALTAAVKEVTPVIASKEYLAPFRALVEGMFLPADDEARRGRIISTMTSAPHHVLAGCWEAIWRYDRERAATDLASLTVPALYVGSYAPVADTARIRELNAAVMVAQTAGAGHFHQLDVPEQVNAMIERFLFVNGLTPRA
jgi:pimeloyl-ACP methyl ester carboxylesterase